MRVSVKRVGAHALPLPAYESAGAVACDLRSNRDVIIKGGETVRIGCGFAFEIPPGHWAQVRSRSSSLGRGHRIEPGTIDSDYRGEVQIQLTNCTTEHIGVLEGDRIAQLVIAPVVRASLVEVAELSETARGEGGFGSSGVR